MISFGVGSRSTGGHLPRGRCFFLPFLSGRQVPRAHPVIDCRPGCLRKMAAAVCEKLILNILWSKRV